MNGLSAPGGEPAVDCARCGKRLLEPVDYGDQAAQVCEHCGAEQP